jgi:hypothetical protein
MEAARATIAQLRGERVRDTDAGAQQFYVQPQGPAGAPNDLVDVQADQIARIEKQYLPQLLEQQRRQREAAVTSLTPEQIKEFEAQRARAPKYISAEDLKEDDRLKAIARHRAALGI